jgi:hypothetical protein
MALVLFVVGIAIGRATSDNGRTSTASAEESSAAATATGKNRSSSSATRSSARPTPRTSTPPPPPPVNGVGAVVDFSGTISGAPAQGSVTLNGIRRTSQSEQSYTDSLPTHGSWLVIDVTVSSTTGEIPYNVYDWTVSTPDGNVQDYDYSVLEEGLGSGTVLPGRIVRGEVAFDVPEGPLFIDYSLGSEVVTTFEITG